MGLFSKKESAKGVYKSYMTKGNILTYVIELENGETKYLTLHSRSSLGMCNPGDTVQVEFKGTHLESMIQLQSGGAKNPLTGM